MCDILHSSKETTNSMSKDMSICQQLTALLFQPLVAGLIDTIDAYIGTLQDDDYALMHMSLFVLCELHHDKFDINNCNTRTWLCYCYKANLLSGCNNLCQKALQCFAIYHCMKETVSQCLGHYNIPYDVTSHILFPFIL